MSLSAYLRPSQLGDLLQSVGYGLPQGTDEPSHQVLSQSRILNPGGLDEAPVESPGGLNGGVVLVGEQVLETLGLGAGEQVDVCQQGVPSLVYSASPLRPRRPVFARWMRRHY